MKRNNPKSCVILKAFILTVILMLVSGCSGSRDPIDPDTGPATIRLVNSQTLSTPGYNGYDPQLTVDPESSDLYVCWTGRIGDGMEIMWRHGDPANLTAEVPITDVDNIRSWNPSLAAGQDGAIHFAYMDQKIDGLQKEIYSRSFVNGLWGPEAILSLPDGWTGWDPDVEVYPDGRPLVVWFDHRYGIQHELILRVGDGQGIW